MQKKCCFNSFIFLYIIFALSVSCVENNPAGTAQYTNPEYPNQFKGYFFCGTSPKAAAFAPNTSVVWISEPAKNFLWYKDVSKAVVNPYVCDTLQVSFSPGLIVAPPSGYELYVHHNNTAQVFTLETNTLRWSLCYTANSTMETMKLSSDGSFLYLGARGTPWHIESVSTENWEQSSSFPMDWPVSRLVVSPDGTMIAAASSARKEVLVLSAPDLELLHTYEFPMRIGTLSFSENSNELIVLDAASQKPYMQKIDIDSGDILFASRPIFSYLSSFVIHGTNTLLLPRNTSTGVSVLNMENMIFAPSLPVDSKVGAVCSSDDGEYIVTVSRTTIPGTATVFIY